MLVLILIYTSLSFALTREGLEKASYGGRKFIPDAAFNLRRSKCSIVAKTGLASNPLDCVDPFIGTLGFGYGVGGLIPGPLLPRGFARPSPDTCLEDGVMLAWRNVGGYSYDDTHIRAFSLTHQDGAGDLDLGVISVMAARGIPTKASVFEEAYRVPFDHVHEVASPGFYQNVLKSLDVTVSLTASHTTGFHRYQFAAGIERATLLFPITHTLLPYNFHKNSSITISPVAGTAFGFVASAQSVTRKPPNGYRYYFYAQLLGNFSVSAHGTWTGAAVMSHSSTSTSGGSGDQVGAYFTFSTAAQTVEIAIAVSLISVAQAKANLAAELSSFDVAHAQAVAAWTKELNSYTGGAVVPKFARTPNTAPYEQYVTQLRVFWTGLYHVSSAPTNYTEPGNGGIYLGFDQKPHKSNGLSFLSDLSIWDIHRTQMPFLATTRPDILVHVINSLLLMKDQGGSLPRWPFATIYSESMVGQHAVIIMADAFLRNVRTGYNVSHMYEVMLDAVTKPQKWAGRSQKDLNAWNKYGYLPSDVSGRSADLTLAWSYDDASVGKIALFLNDTKNAKLLAKRSMNYKNIWNSKTQLFCPRSSSGQFDCPSELESYNPFDSRFDQGDAQQYVWFVLHDLPGLIDLMGGNTSYAHRLDKFCNCTFEFDASNFLPNPCVWIGNEPSLAIPFEFNPAGRADLSALQGRRIALEYFPDHPDGVPGNDDYSATTSWLVWSITGLYPLAGSDKYFLHAPVFEQMVLNLGDSKILTIQAHNMTAPSLFTPRVASVKLNGVLVDYPANAIVTHYDLTAKANNLLQFFFE